MKNPTTQLSFYSFFVLLLLLSVSWLATSQEVEDEREFSYDVQSANGPHHWGEIHEEWSSCGNGDMQSPIDLLDRRVEVVPYSGRLKRNYRPSNATLINRGHDMMLSWEGGAGYIQVNGSRYQLNQVHWHSPSEHTINGKRFDLEIHLVHESADGKAAVVGILYEIGLQPDSFLSMMEDDLQAVADTRGVERAVGVINPKQIEIGSRRFYRYIGSLTTPPCTEGVLWTMFRKVRTVTIEQVRLIREAVHDDAEANARPLQAINRRPVKFYRRKVHEVHN